MDLVTLAEKSPYVILVAVLLYGLRTLWDELKAERAAHNATRDKAQDQVRANDATLRAAVEALSEGSTP